MATTSTKHAEASFETAFEQFKDQGEHLITVQQEWLKRVIDTQTDFARELTESYTAAVRSFLK